MRAAAEHEIPHSFEGKARSDVNSGGNLEEYEFYLQKAIELPHWAVSAIKKLRPLHTQDHKRAASRKT